MDGKTATSDVQISEQDQKGAVKSGSLDSLIPNIAYSRQVYSLAAYFMFMLLFSFWLLFDVWSEKFVLMRFLGLNEKALADPLLRTINFTIIGGLFGSILFHIRHLFTYYAKTTGDYNPRWFPKYITGPWEGAALALIVLSLIRGGVALFGGSMGTDVTGANNFSAFGVGALVGFGMRDVVGWLGNLVQTMFTVHAPGQPEGPSGLATRDGKSPD